MVIDEQTKEKLLKSPLFLDPLFAQNSIYDIFTGKKKEAPVTAVQNTITTENKPQAAGTTPNNNMAKTSNNQMTQNSSGFDIEERDRNVRKAYSERMKRERSQDPFLQGFNADKKAKEEEKAKYRGIMSRQNTNNPYGTGMWREPNTGSFLFSGDRTKVHNLPYTGKNPKVVQYSLPETRLGGDIESDDELELFIRGMQEENGTYEKKEEAKPTQYSNDPFLEGFNDPYGEKKEEKKEKSTYQKVLDGASTALTVASFVPGLDTVTNLLQIPVDLLRGDFVGAGLDLVGAIPFVGEIADIGKTARTADRIIDTAKVIDKADDVADAVKVADKAGEVYEASKALTKVDDATEAAKSLTSKESKVASIADNVPTVAKKYNLNTKGFFGEQGKNTRIFRCDNPIESSADFYKKISKGGFEMKLSNGKGVQTLFEDGTRVIYRVKTSTPDSPAVQISVTVYQGIKNQKIHFLR